MKNYTTSAPCTPQSRYGRSVSFRIKNPELLHDIDNMPHGKFSEICKAALIQYFEATEGVHYEYI
jgi:hypothetical protein